MSDAVLVTGAFGLVGSATVKRLAAAGRHEYLKRHSPYYKAPGKYADPWGAVQRKWGRFEADKA